MKNLNLLRLKGESDADIIDRLVELSRCYMIAKGASDQEYMEAED